MTTKKKRGSQASRSALVVLDDVQKRLATIETVDEAKSIIDQAELFRVYAKKAWKGLEVQNHCTYIKLGAERRAGELLAQIEREAGKRDGETSYQAVMRSAELDAMTAHRWQRLARLTVAQLETFWRECDRAGEELTSARVAREFKTQMGPNGDASERERSEGEQVYDAAKTLKQSADRFLQLGCDDESLVLILRDRRYFDSGNVQGLRSSFFALRDRLGVAIGQLTWRMNVKMDEHLDSLTRDSLVAKAERSVEQPDTEPAELVTAVSAVISRTVVPRRDVPTLGCAELVRCAFEGNARLLPACADLIPHMARMAAQALPRRRLPVRRLGRFLDYDKRSRDQSPRGDSLAGGDL